VTRGDEWDEARGLDRQRGDIAPPSAGAHVSAVLILATAPAAAVAGFAGGGWHGAASVALATLTGAFVAAVYGGWSQRYRKRRHGE
jgi:hypothetical protein